MEGAAGDPTATAAGMVFYLHMVVTDSARDEIMALAQTLLVTGGDAEVLTFAQPTYRALG